MYILKEFDSVFIIFLCCNNFEMYYWKIRGFYLFEKVKWWVYYEIYKIKLKREKFNCFILNFV